MFVKMGITEDCFDSSVVSVAAFSGFVVSLFVDYFEVVICEEEAWFV